MRVHFIAAAVLLMACATPTSGGSRIGDLDSNSATDCQYLADISESQYSGMLFAGQGLEGARAKVRNRASDMGATHVVWGSMSAGGAVQVASAKAHKCPTAPAG